MKVSEYLIPARGLKQKFNIDANSLLNGFRISNPRKGTETEIKTSFLAFSILFPNI